MVAYPRMVLRRRTKIARRLRREATDVEKQLWRALRERLPEFRFRRQHPIGPYVVDFACPRQKLAIEIDGGQHAINNNKDAVRAAELGHRGYRVIRFWNSEVAENLQGVLEAIYQKLHARSL